MHHIYNFFSNNEFWCLGLILRAHISTKWITICLYKLFFGTRLVSAHIYHQIWVIFAQLKGFIILYSKYGECMASFSIWDLLIMFYILCHVPVSQKTYAFHVPRHPVTPKLRRCHLGPPKHTNLKQSPFTSVSVFAWKHRVCLHLVPPTKHIHLPRLCPVHQPKWVQPFRGRWILQATYGWIGPKSIAIGDLTHTKW